MTTYRTQRDLPYSQIPITLDNNQNYKRYEPETTVIPNFYSIREDIKRELRLNKQDFVNNNLVSPKVHRHEHRLALRILGKLSYSE
ncbi:hypothetical protein OESDEN_18857 [Oesophagostomum dentatum]|uniref:Uncharacterized protein n=1 Tax=Oesophagostomum dentatum TaxID=61180 RepID=A0A0B1SD38_OESDE|nr:hypothetical protein OESDEN_18857 [Oesophagostomum dentatum]